MLSWALLCDRESTPSALALTCATVHTRHDAQALADLLGASHPTEVAVASRVRDAQWEPEHGVHLLAIRDQVRPVAAFMAASPGDLDIGLAAGCKWIVLPAQYAPPAPRPSNSSLYAVILQALSQSNEEDEPFAIESTLRTDPALWVRLLRYLNSPTVAPQREILGLEQGLALIGYRGLARWCALSLVTAQIHLSGALRCAALRALIRANAMELLCREYRTLRSHADSAFLMGLLTELPSLTGLPATQLAQQLRLPEEARTWLSQRSRHDPAAKPVSPYMALGDWADASERIDTEQALEMQTQRLADLQCESAMADSVLLTALLRAWSQAGLAGSERFS